MQGCNIKNLYWYIEWVDDTSKYRCWKRSATGEPTNAARAISGQRRWPADYPVHFKVHHQFSTRLSIAVKERVVKSRSTCRWWGGSVVYLLLVLTYVGTYLFTSPLLRLRRSTYILEKHKFLNKNWIVIKGIFLH